jgi:hypothetical protein
VTVNLQAAVLKADLAGLADKAATGQVLIVHSPEDVLAAEEQGAVGWLWPDHLYDVEQLREFRGRTVELWSPKLKKDTVRLAVRQLDLLTQAGARVHPIDGRGAFETLAESYRDKHGLADAVPISPDDLRKRAGLDALPTAPHRTNGNGKVHDVSRPYSAVTSRKGADHSERTDSSEGDEGHRRISLTPASAIGVRPVRWLWADRIALGTLALLAGREGIGKSTVSYQLAADLTRGRLSGSYFGQPKAVIVAATEDSWEHTIVPRLMAADANLDLVFRVDVTTSVGFTGTLNLPSDLGALRKCIETVGAALVLLDPLISRLDAKLDTHKDADVRQALEPLVALADRCDIALVGLIHLNKSDSSDPLTMLMGSRAFAAVARAVLFVTVDPEDENTRILGQPKNNLGRTDLPSLTFTIHGSKVADTDEGPVCTGRLQWEGQTDRSIADVLRSANESTEARTATQEAVEWLTDYLELHKVASSQTIKMDGKQAGHSADALKRARRKIGAGSISHGYPRRTYWSAPGLTPDQVERLLDQNAKSEQNNQSSHGESAPTALTAPTGE